MSTHCAHQKFHMALRNLVAPEDIHSRLTSAFSHQLIHLDVESDMPKSLQADFRELLRLVNHGVEPKGHVSDLIGEMEEYETEKLAQHTVELFETISSCAAYNKQSIRSYIQ